MIYQASHVLGIVGGSVASQWHHCRNHSWILTPLWLCFLKLDKLSKRKAVLALVVHAQCEGEKPKQQPCHGMALLPCLVTSVGCCGSVGPWLRLLKWTLLR